MVSNLWRTEKALRIPGITPTIPPEIKAIITVIGQNETRHIWIWQGKPTTESSLPKADQEVRAFEACTTWRLRALNFSQTEAPARKKSLQFREACKAVEQLLITLDIISSRDVAPTNSKNTKSRNSVVIFGSIAPLSLGFHLPSRHTSSCLLVVSGDTIPWIYQNNSNSVWDI